MPVRDTAWPAGTPCWIDYSAEDADAAKAFYSDLLGWSYTEGAPEYGGYATCLSSGRAAAGIAPRMDPSTPPSWTTYFATDDADAASSAIKAAGGAVVVEPMDVGPLGRMAVATDKEGNFFGLWQSGEHTGVDVFNEPGALTWNDASVKDLDEAQAFYGSVFGFSFEEMEGAGGYVTFARGGDPLGGLGAHAEGLPTGWTACFAVASADSAVERTTDAGGAVLMPATDSPYGRFAVLADPWGASFSVMETAPG